MSRFRKKPVEIEARQVRTVKDMDDTYEWIWENGGKAAIRDIGPPHDGFYISTLEGEMKVSEGDWVIRGVAGEFYPCKPDIFAATYDPVEEN